jgi:putative hydrolase of HD superfamily
MEPQLSRALTLARISLAFGRVERVTRHEDGTRPETDTDHTVMLGLVACELAPPHLDRAKVAAFALVHDLVEVYAGDAQTLVISAEARVAKKAREEAAAVRLVAELGEGSWLAGLLATYERQREPEARFVRLLDKVLPKLTHAFNGCVAAMPLTDCEGFVAAHDRQLRALSEEYPEFPEALELLRASMLHAEACWQGPGAER